jgi:hypothetical protein
VALQQSLWYGSFFGQGFGWERCWCLGLVAAEKKGEKEEEEEEGGKKDKRWFLFRRGTSVLFKSHSGT